MNGEEKLGYISKTGEYVEYDVRLAFMHELIHAVTGLEDTDGSTVFSSPEASLGPTQVIANKIHIERFLFLDFLGVNSDNVGVLDDDYFADVFALITFEFQN